MSETAPGSQEPTIRRHARNGDPWWLLLMGEYQKRGAKDGKPRTEGRLGLAFLTAARASLFGCPEDAEDCLNEIRCNTTGLVLGFWCVSKHMSVLGFDPYSRMNKKRGFSPFASLTAEWHEHDNDRVCARMVQEAQALLKAGTPSREPFGFQGSIPVALTKEDLADIEAVRRMLSDQ